MFDNSFEKWFFFLKKKKRKEKKKKVFSCDIKVRSTVFIAVVLKYVLR
jgi:hypothetical protein